MDQFLGIKVNHFAEVTMVAFFQIAQVVQPITVCVKEDTQDSYSGANFHAGVSTRRKRSRSCGSAGTMCIRS